MTGILIVAEHNQGIISDITGEIIGAAVSLKKSLGGPIILALLTDNPSALIEDVNLAGVDEILTMNVGTSHFDAAIYEEAAYQAGLNKQPGLILLVIRSMEWPVPQLWLRV